MAYGRYTINRSPESRARADRKRAEAARNEAANRRRANIDRQLEQRAKRIVDAYRERNDAA